MPGHTDPPAWPTHRAHLLLIAAHGTAPVAQLAAVAGSRELNSADDRAAALDWPRDDTGHRAVDLPPVFGQSNGDGFALQPDQGLDEAMTAWQGEVARGRELIAGASLDDSGRLSEEEAGHVGDQGVSLRWIMVHMIEEYARHNGHADLIRERIDGVAGA